MGGVGQLAVEQQEGDFFITRLRRELGYIKAAIREAIARGLGGADRCASGDDALESSRGQRSHRISTRRSPDP